MGIDELVDDVDEQKDEDEAKSLLDKFGVDSREELEELDDRLSRALRLLVQYDKRIEELEGRVTTLEALFYEQLKEQSEDTNGGSKHEESESDDDESFSWE